MFFLIQALYKLITIVAINCLLVSCHFHYKKLRERSKLYNTYLFKLWWLDISYCICASPTLPGYSFKTKISLAENWLSILPAVTPLLIMTQNVELEKAEIICCHSHIYHHISWIIQLRNDDFFPFFALFGNHTFCEYLRTLINIPYPYNQ